MSVYIKDRYDLLIGGQWVPAENGDTFVTSNPATGEELAVCANASAADVDRAVRAAREAFPAWSSSAQVETFSLSRWLAQLSSSPFHHSKSPFF